MNSITKINYLYILCAIINLNTKEMKKRKGALVVLPIIFTMSLYLVFYDKIASKPTDAGFWFILILGMSIGIGLSRLFKK